MVIISDKSGQLANRIFLYAHFIANSIELNYKLVNPGFYDYAHYFNGTNNNIFLTYPQYKSSIKFSFTSVQKVIYYIINIISRFMCKLYLHTRFLRVLDISSRDEDYILSEYEFVNLAKLQHFLLVRGWLFRDNNSFKKHQKQLRNFFKPVDKHIENIDLLIDKARINCDVLVGIHIRQGDYDTFMDGIYFYDTNDYVDIIKRTRELWKDKRVKYLICSNEKQDIDLFSEINCIFGNDNEIEDLYSFAQCDYLIGAPSTYTMWASFYGSVPLFIVDELKKPITIKEFRIHC